MKLCLVRVYLTAAARNPTRYEIMFPGFTSPEQYDEAIADLEASRVRHIVLIPRLFVAETDRMYAWVNEHYRCAGEERPCLLYTRSE